MKHYLKLLPLLFLISILSFAQGGLFNDTVLSGIGIPFAVARICTPLATGTPCTPLANVYSDSALTLLINQTTNPVTADVGGNLHLYALPGLYLAQYTSPTTGATVSQMIQVPGYGASSLNFPLLAPNGTNAAPSYSFAAFPGGGLFIDTASRTAISAADGTEVLEFRSGRAMSLAANGLLAFTSGSGDPTASLDTGLSRISAGVFGLGTGAQGSAAGQLNLAKLLVGGDTAFSSAPRMIWSGGIICGVTFGANCRSSADMTLDKAITITRLTLLVLTAPAGCTTSYQMGVRNGTQGTYLASITLVNGQSTYDSGVLSANAAAGDDLLIVNINAAAGCTTNPANLGWAVQYKMQ